MLEINLNGLINFIMGIGCILANQDEKVPGREFVDKVTGFLLAGGLSGQEEPKHSLGKGLGGTVFGGLGENAVALRNGVTSETDTFLGVELGDIVEETHHAAHTTKSLVQSDLDKRKTSWTFLLPCC